MQSHPRFLLPAFILAIVLSAAVGVATAPRGETLVTRVTPGASFSPGLSVGPASPTEPPLEPTASTGALPIERLPVVRFTPTSGGTAALPVEVPPTSEYGIGLSGRRTLDGRGMLFFYPDGKGSAGFWMKDTHIDLEIAFVDVSMKVIAVLTMRADTETVHRPSQPYLAAIEAPVGYFSRTGIGVGAKVEFLFDPASLVKP